MTDLPNNQTDSRVSFPTVSIRSLLLGMLAMNVLNGLIILFSMCAIPLLLMFSLGFFDKSIAKINTLLILTLVVTCSIAINLVQICIWCIRRLFSTLADRIVVATLLLAWHILLIAAMSASYFDIGLVLIVLGLAIWDRFLQRQQEI